MEIKIYPTLGASPFKKFQSEGRTLATVGAKSWNQQNSSAATGESRVGDEPFDGNHPKLEGACEDFVESPATLSPPWEERPWNLCVRMAY